MIHFFFHIWHWFQQVTGTTINPAIGSKWYNWWSGIGSDLGEATIVVGLVAWWRQGECHVDTCHKRGKYPFQHYKLCKIHHPDVPGKITHAHIKKLKGTK